MLFDPSLRAAVYRDARSALPDDDLTETELAWLSRPDERRWSADPYRQARCLEILIEEFPASVGQALRHMEMTELMTFFSSQHFHEGIRNDRPLTEGFGQWLSNVMTSAFLPRSNFRSREADVSKIKIITSRANRNPMAETLGCHPIRFPTVDWPGIWPPAPN